MLVVGGVLLLGTTSPAAAQDSLDNAATRATLRGWEEQARLTIFDRAGTYYGRLSDQGILQRFNPDIDREYHLDLISFAFSLAETYEWYQRNAGVRFWAGSIDHLRTVQNGQIAGVVNLGGSWAARAQFTHQNTLQADRSLIELQVNRKVFGENGLAFGSVTLSPIKAEMDIELGVGIPLLGESRLTVAVAALDVFSNFIYQGIGVEGVSDTTLDYTSLPFTARTALDANFSEHLRGELFALAMTPTQVVVREGGPEIGFQQDERYAYLGGLLEWHPSPAAAVGGFGTWVQVKMFRSALSEGIPEDDFDLTERSWRLGGYTMVSISSRFATDAWITHTWRTEVRTRPDTSVATNVDHEDRSWAGRLNLGYRAQSGFRLDLGLDFLTRELVGSAPVPGSEVLDDKNIRARLDLGWHFGSRAYVVIGTNADLDGDVGGWAKVFDGGHARFAAYW
jgi:hypothetical protein